MKKVLVSTLLAFCSISVQAGITDGDAPPPIRVPGGDGLIVPTPTNTGVINLPTGVDWYCLQHSTIPVVIHLNGEKVEIRIRNPLCPRR